MDTDNGNRPPTTLNRSGIPNCRISLVFDRIYPDSDVGSSSNRCPKEVIWRVFGHSSWISRDVQRGWIWHLASLHDRVRMWLEEPCPYRSVTHGRTHGAIGPGPKRNGRAECRASRVERRVGGTHVLGVFDPVDHQQPSRCGCKPQQSAALDERSRHASL